MDRETLLELIVQMEQERVKLVKRAEEAERREKAWYQLWREKESMDNVCDSVSDR